MRSATTTPVVLVIDDSPTTRSFIRSLLRRENLDVIEAVSARAALELAPTCKPDLVLLDIILPDGNGFDLVAPLREAFGAPVPILAVTGLISRADEGRLGGAGFDDIVHKPIDPERLRTALRTFLPERAAAAPLLGAGRRLLYVDDDPVQRKLAALRLQRLGFEVQQAGNGRDAYTAAKRQPPDVIVSDVLMPGLDGFQLCALVRRDREIGHIPVVLITNSYLEEDDRMLATSIGADGYVIRTHDLRELVELLAKMGRGARRTPQPLVAEGASAGTDRLVRAAHQLDRQLALNVTLTQRTAVLSAQLEILGGLTNTLLEDGDVESALDQALHACLDAGGISWGLLFVKHREQWRSRSLGLTDDERRVARDSLESVIETLQGTRSRAPTRVDGTLVGFEPESDALIVPVARKDELLGAIVLRLSPTLDEQRIAFIQVVAGQVAMVLALARTFQHLDQTSRAERGRAQLLASTLDAIGTPLLVVDAEGGFARSNEPGKDYSFLTHGEPDAARYVVMTGDRVEPLRWCELPIARALAGEPIDDAELCVRRDDAEPRWLRITARVVQDELEVAGAVAVIRDVTEERRAQARLVVNDRLASVGVLAAGVAHEINNPLMAVLAEVEMGMEMVRDNTAAVERLEMAIDAAHRVRTIVSDLRTLSRESSQDALTLVDPSRALDIAVRIVGPQVRSARGRIELDLEPLPSVRANEGRLVQVFLNLLVNAIHAVTNEAASDRRVVTIRARRGRDGGARIDILDAGIGMSAEVRARLFTPFFTTKPPGTGTGLGLSISQGILAKLGGTIDCESKLGVGTTFSIWIPAFSKEQPPTVPRDQRRRIVVVEPDPFARQTITRTFRADHEIVHLVGGAQICARLEAGEAFDLVFYDAASSELAIDALHAHLASVQGRPALVGLVGPTFPAERVEQLTRLGVRCLVKPLRASVLSALAAELWGRVEDGPAARRT